MSSIRPLRKWQETAFDAWQKGGRRGIVAVVTGGGKTVFALHCLREYRKTVPAATALIVVPTAALLDQWIEEAIDFFGVSLKEIVILSAKRKIKQSKINIGVINTVAQLAEHPPSDLVFMIVDECHKAGSPVFQQIFKIPSDASLGLSATPERPYDTAFEDVLLPNLGPVLFTYTYKEALIDKVIVPFTLTNVVFEFDAEEQEKYNKLTKGIQFTIKRFGPESSEAIALMLKRARLSNISLSRVRITLKIIAKNAGSRILVFHEDIDACNLINSVLLQNHIASGVYHSKIPMPDRVATLSAYRAGRIRVLVTCRALDEGFNVPETEIGIIAASTATYRQRVQRLGRILRPSPGKGEAQIFSIVAAVPEIRRLAEEAQDMEEIANVVWTRE